MMRYFLLVLSVLLLASCSPVSIQPQTTYVLNTLPIPTKSQPTRPISLLVTDSEGYSIYNTKLMAYSIDPSQIAYFSKNGWVETPAHMIRPLIVQVLQNTRHFRAVASYPTIGNYDYILNIQVIELRQMFLCNKSFVNLTLQAQLINTSNGKVLAAKRFSVVEPSPQNSPWGGAIAANRATAGILQQLEQFCLKKL